MTAEALPLGGVAEETLDPTRFVRQDRPDHHVLNLMVDNVHCAACISKIEKGLTKFEDVDVARVNLSTGRLVVGWTGSVFNPKTIVQTLTDLGYPAAPFDPETAKASRTQEESQLLWAVAVSGFGAMNIMMLSVAVWTGAFTGIDESTRTLFHWISGLIGVPCTIYAARPFFSSAWGALKGGSTNMDVPIALAIILALGISIFEAIQHGEHTFFDAAIMLTFFLLIGRYLDRRARARARSAAEHLLALQAPHATRVDASGHHTAVPVEDVLPGDTVFVATGDRIPLDGKVLSGQGHVDAAMITGETEPVAVSTGDQVYAGTINLAAPLTLHVTSTADDSVLAEIVKMMENAEQGRAKYVQLADRAAQMYGPFVNVLAAGTLLGWLVFADITVRDAIFICVSVLIITCPCALGLAVPVVQVVASGVLMKRGILLKSGDALERTADIDHVVFDKTGTLTTGAPSLRQKGQWTEDDLKTAAKVARYSRHPLAQALTASAPSVSCCGTKDVEEHPGAGLSGTVGGVPVLVGSRAFVGVAETTPAATASEIWFRHGEQAPVVFEFEDQPKTDASTVIASLKQLGLPVEILSGDREAVVASVAAELGVDHWAAELKPDQKVARLEEIKAQGRKVMMVGDGLNDAPALAAAHASMSPTSAADISQTAADMVFQGGQLAPVLAALQVSKMTKRLVLQNFTQAAAYNVVAVPLAVAGLVTPMIAAIVMSVSSITVTLNALRLKVLS